MKAVIQAAFATFSIFLSLFTIQTEANALRRHVGSFEVIINEETTYQLRYSRRNARLQILPSNPTLVTQARIQNLKEDVKTSTSRTLIKCALVSNAPANYLSPFFDQDTPLAEPFPDAVAIACVPNSWDKSIEGGDTSWQPISDPPAFVFMEDSKQRYQVLALDLEPQYRPKHFADVDVFFTKVALLDVQEPRTVCQINVRREESIFLKVGESFEDELGVDVALVNCFIDFRGQFDRS